MLITDLSPDARVIADMLIACPVGETVTHRALSEAIGRDITRCRHIYYTAARVAQREAGAVFVTMVRQGYRRLEHVNIAPTVGPAARHHIRRTARKARRIMIAGTAGMNDMRPEDQRKLAAEISAMGLIEHVAQDARVKPDQNAPMAPTPVAITAQRLLESLQK